MLGKFPQNLIGNRGGNMQKPFDGLLGNNSELRTLELLLPQHGVEYNISELADEVDVTRQTMAKVIRNFEYWKLVTPIRTERNIVYYSINDSSPLVRSLKQLNNALIETILGEEELYKIRDYLKTQVPTIIPLSKIYDGHIIYPAEPEKWSFESPELGTASGSDRNPMIIEREKPQHLLSPELRMEAT